MSFQREERYIVVKMKDLSDVQADILNELIDSWHIPERYCVVVESDWPIYEQTWDAVQRLAESRPQRIAELEAERDDADRRAGAAERECAHLKSSEIARNDWLRNAKQEAGYDPSVSYDVVWEETLRKARELDQLRDERDELSRDWDSEHYHRLAVERERDALAAHVERLSGIIRDCFESEPDPHDKWEIDARIALDDVHQTSLARRDEELLHRLADELLKAELKSNLEPGDNTPLDDVELVNMWDASQCADWIREQAKGANDERTTDVSVLRV